MDIKSLYHLLTKRGWIIVLVAVGACAGAVITSKLQTPMFRSTVKLLMRPARYDFGLTEAGKLMMGQLSLRLQAPSLAEEVIQQRGLTVTAQTLLRRARVGTEEGKYVIQLSVDDPDAGTARAVADTWAKAFADRYNNRNKDIDPRDRISVEIYDAASPAELNRPRTRVNALAGTLLGLIVGGLVAVALEYLDDSLKNAEDVERHVGLTTLGSIPSSSR
ncbi:MAG: hypothetical protein HY783_05270 [Chloroflexi bacterium]|nr:hypothetical protein [Chloroflexota bacterium]